MQVEEKRREEKQYSSKGGKLKDFLARKVKIVMLHELVSSRRMLKYQNSVIIM